MGVTLAHAPVTFALGVCPSQGHTFASTHTPWQLHLHHDCRRIQLMASTAPQATLPEPPPPVSDRIRLHQQLAPSGQSQHVRQPKISLHLEVVNYLRQQLHINIQQHTSKTTPSHHTNLPLDPWPCIWQGSPPQFASRGANLCPNCKFSSVAIN